MKFMEKHFVNNTMKINFIYSLRILRMSDKLNSQSFINQSYYENKRVIALLISNTIFILQFICIKNE